MRSSLVRRRHCLDPLVTIALLAILNLPSSTSVLLDPKCNGEPTMPRSYTPSMFTLNLQSLLDVYSEYPSIQKFHAEITDLLKTISGVLQPFHQTANSPYQSIKSNSIYNVLKPDDTMPRINLKPSSPMELNSPSYGRFSPGYVRPNDLLMPIQNSPTVSRSSKDIVFIPYPVRALQSWYDLIVSNKLHCFETPAGLLRRLAEIYEVSGQAEFQWAEWPSLLPSPSSPGEGEEDEEEERYSDDSFTGEYSMYTPASRATGNILSPSMMQDVTTRHESPAAGAGGEDEDDEGEMGDEGDENVIFTESRVESPSPSPGSWRMGTQSPSSPDFDRAFGAGRGLFRTNQLPGAGRLREEEEQPDPSAGLYRADEINVDETIYYTPMEWRQQGTLGSRNAQTPSQTPDQSARGNNPMIQVVRMPTSELRSDEPEEQKVDYSAYPYDDLDNANEDRLYTMGSRDPLSGSKMSRSAQSKNSPLNVGQFVPKGSRTMPRQSDGPPPRKAMQYLDDSLGEQMKGVYAGMISQLMQMSLMEWVGDRAKKEFSQARVRKNVETLRHGEAVLVHFLASVRGFAQQNSGRIRIVDRNEMIRELQ